ncbi:MAG TPA: SUMF1/EgtB/PvdO family nonheme iron enzyme [Candidatus Brocadiia bacterium]|nr:SUMF1/EgtB/PvdO family nonheme iron enzyme [Candidatus Brocadiia bacterium]
MREPDGAEMVLVRDGAFAMGTQLAARDEGPRHLVYTSRFFIDRYEVTNRQYRAFCEAKGYPEPAGTTFVNNKRSDDFMPWQSERFNRDDMPVVCVSYADAHEYTQWLNAILPWDSDWETDLPTEAEWEKAAAGMQGLPYPWGSTADPKRVVMGGGYDETAGLKDAKAMPSGMSPFGLHHCLGNAKEWCLDWYNPSTYSLRIQKGRNGICATDPVGPSDGQLRCLRGGGWADSLSAIRCQTRDGAEPGIKRDDVGFRCVVRLKARARRKS